MRWRSRYFGSTFAPENKFIFDKLLDVTRFYGDGYSYFWTLDIILAYFTGLAATIAAFGD